MIILQELRVSLTSSTKIKHFNDFNVGDKFLSSTYFVSKQEIVDFALKYDPLSFHTGELDAKFVDHLYDVLTASGSHITAICMRLFDDTILSHSSVISSPGHEYIKWPNPIKESDTVRAEFEVIEKRISSKDNTNGIVTFRKVMKNQENKIVFDSKTPIMFKV